MATYFRLLLVISLREESFAYPSSLGPILVIPTSLCFPVIIFGESDILMAD